MGIDARIIDEKNDCTVGISRDRWLYTGPSQTSKAYNATLGVDDTPVNIVPPRAGCDFIITDIILVGNKNISTSIDAVVDIYEATSATSGTSADDILTLPVSRSGSIILNGVHLGTDEARYVNGKTSDDDVLVTILGFYVKSGGN